MNRKWILVLVLFLAAGTLVFAGGKSEGAGGKGYTIGFSNSYAGNTYRQTMEALFRKLADQMGQSLVLADVPKNIRNMIKLVNLDKRILIFDTVDEALA